MMYKTIERIARDILSSSGDLSNEGLSRMLYTLKPIIDTIGDYISPDIKSELFTIDSSYSIKLPDNVINPIKIGKIINGKVHPLGLDPSIRDITSIPVSSFTVVNETGQCACSPISENAPILDYVNPDDGQLPNSLIFHNYPGTVGEVYGYKEPQFKLGTYRYISSRRTFEFGSGYGIAEGERILIEYIADDKLNRYRLIPSDAFNFIRHKVLQIYNEADGNLGMVRHHRRQYEIELDIFENRHNPLSPTDIVAAFVGGYASIK